MADLAPRIIGAFVIAYLVGGIPWSLIIGKRFFGIDPRQHGSGNLGATNVFRLLGARAAAVTLLLDAAKGAAAVLVAWLLVPADVYGITVSDWTAVGAMMAAVLGHAYSPYIGFKGGKGVATSAGALFVLTPAAALLCLFVFALVVVLSRMVSLGSIVVALIYPPLTMVLYPGRTPLIIVIFILAALVIWRHRSNIVRIARGEESKISLRRRGAAVSGSPSNADVNGSGGEGDK